MALLGFNPFAAQLSQAQPAPESFVWGEGGQRMTPEEIAQQRRFADQQRMAGADFSPVGSVWEGLGRVVQGYSGGAANRRAERASDANAAQSDALLEAILSDEPAADGGGDMLLAAMGNPYVSDRVRDIAEMQYQQLNPGPVEPVIKQRNDGSFVGLNPLTGQVMFENADPNPKPVLDWLTADNPDGTKTIIPVGPQGPITRGGGGQASEVGASTPTAPVGKLTPVPEGGPASAPDSFPR